MMNDDMQEIRDRINTIEDDEQLVGSKVREMMLSLLDYMETQVAAQRSLKEIYRKTKTNNNKV